MFGLILRLNIKRGCIHEREDRKKHPGAKNAENDKEEIENSIVAGELPFAE